jgi:hypothetical protein
LAQVLSFEKPALLQPPFPPATALSLQLPSPFCHPERSRGICGSVYRQPSSVGSVSLSFVIPSVAEGNPGAGFWQMLFGAFRPQAIRIFGKTCALSALSALSGVSDDQDSQVHTRLDHNPGLKVSVLAKLTASGRPSGLSHRMLSRSGIGKLKSHNLRAQPRDLQFSGPFVENVFLESAPEWWDLRFLPETGSYNEAVDIRLWSPKIYPWNVPPTY